MHQAIASPFLIPFDASFHLSEAATAPEEVQKKGHLKKQLQDCVDELQDLQRILYAYSHHSVLLIFQAMDAAGKDSTIRAVLSGVNPAGCQIFSFKQPTAEELDHDFLWRSAKRLPERGRIGVFNRSYYEEVLVVRVHPEYLDAQNIPNRDDLQSIWKQRFESIRTHEEHLARNGTVILKFWLNVSEDEQCNRFLKRIDEPKKNWKFSSHDVAERQHWQAYMNAYEEALNATSRPWAPWYAIPADSKPFMRTTVAQILVQTLQSLDLHYPKVSKEEQAELQEMRRVLMQKKD